MHLSRPEFKLAEINSGSRYHCLPICRKRCIIDYETKVVPQFVQNGMLHGSKTWPVRKKMRWHFSEQKREWSGVCLALVKD